MFKSKASLKSALVQCELVTEENLKEVELSRDSQLTEYMYVDQTNPTVPLGYATVTYMGIVPGHGRMWDTVARMCSLKVD